MHRLAIFTDFPLLPTKGYRVFFDTLLNSGKIELVDVNNPTSADLAISFNHTNQNLQKIVASGIKLDRRILVMYECNAILPLMHQRETLGQYGVIFAPSHHWAQEFAPRIFRYPFFLEQPKLLTPLSTRPYLFGIIQRNKFSCIKGEMYTLRRQVIRDMDSKGIFLVLRGGGWGEGHFRNLMRYLRILYYYSKLLEWNKLIFIPRALIIPKTQMAKEVKNKQDFLSSVKVAIIIENDLTYVSEKIFDCFRAGTVPIYVGPRLVEFGIPENTVIRADSSSESVISILMEIEKYNLEEIADNGMRFLQGPGGASWDERSSMGSLANSILDLL